MIMFAKRLTVVGAALLVLTCAASAWHRHGHVLASRTAVELAGERLPAFVRQKSLELLEGRRGPDFQILRPGQGAARTDTT
jgi:hypothetical protein